MILRCTIALGWLLVVAEASHAQSATTATTDSKGAKRPSPPAQVLLKARASEINPAAHEYPELGYLFADGDGQPQDIQHASVDLAVPQRGELVIWLMGYNAGLFERVNRYGLHAIQPHYANRWFGTLSPKDRDSGQSLGDIRLEAATGRDHSALIELDYADGLTQRALQFVKWLAAEHPAGQWNQFLNDSQDDLRWDKVILAGSSHGSTTAARFAKHQRVARVVMFSGPRDQFESWQGLESATPANRFFGFTHGLDAGWTGKHYCRSWIMLGLADFGPIVDVDVTPLVPSNSRRLITHGDVSRDADRAHSASVPGKSAIKSSAGEFIHEPVWEYLFTHPVDQVGQPVAAEGNCPLDNAGKSAGQ